MRLGVLTFHHTTNFGATLQAYSVTRALGELGHDAHLIDYRHPAAVAYYRRRMLRSRAVVPNIIKASKHLSFLKRAGMLKGPTVRDRSGLANAISGLDGVVVGSDQVWHTGSLRKYAPEYFLDFVPDNVKKISYAPSAGDLESFGDHQSEIGNLLGRFDHICARDERTRSLVEGACGVDPPKVLDPTFVPDVIDVGVPNARPKEPYILLYAELEPQYVEVVRAFAKKLGMPVVAAGQRSAGADIDRLGIGPREWVGLFAGASLVLTTFFHGTIFGILHRKPLCVFPRKTKGAKVGDLLGRLDLQSAYWDDAQGAGPEALERHIGLDYSGAEGAIAREREASWAYLRRATGVEGGGSDG